MKRSWLRATVLLVPAACVIVGQQPKAPPTAATTASGVFLGRSGKPMAKAQLFLGTVAGDEDESQAKVKMLGKSFIAVTDEKGNFQFKGLAPGEYTIVYQPAGESVTPPAEINIKPIATVVKSIAPVLRNVELGKSDAYDKRAWDRELTLMKGHTFWSAGTTMKLWNATVRRNPQGPFLEVRKGRIWMQRLDDKTQIKFDAWSY